MRKQVYIIYDNTSKNFGDLLTFDNDEEATRFFIYSCSNCDWYKDLKLFCLGEVHNVDDTDAVVIESDKCYFHVVCLGEDLSKEVEELRNKRAEVSAIQSEIAKTFRQPQFVEDVVRLSRYLQKNDKKRFNR